jgi:hypothetical protein
MRRWIVAMVAVAFLAGGPALAGGKSCGKHGGDKGSNCPSQQLSAGGCGQAMKAGGCAQASACRGAMAKPRCGQAMGAGAGASCGSMAKCGSMANCRSMANCGSMASCGSWGNRTMPISYDRSNIWYRGPAPRATVADWACDNDRGEGHRAMRCGDRSSCGHAMNSCPEMESGRTDCKAGTGMTHGTGCPHARGRTAWKAGCSANTLAPKGGCCTTGTPKAGCCAGHGDKS